LLFAVKGLMPGKSSNLGASFDLIHAGDFKVLAYQREAPRLCRGGSRSLTFPAAIDERPRLVSHHAHEKEFRDGPVLMSLLTSEENRVVLRTYHCL